MDYDQILKDTVSVFYDNFGNRLSEQSALHFLRGLLSVRDTECILETAPRHLLQIVCEHKDFHGKCTYSCDILQLRGILQNKKIVADSKIILFSNKVAERVLKQQKCRIVLNLDPQDIKQETGHTCELFGGMAIVDTHCLDIENLVQSIVVDCKDYNKVKIVEDIVKETNTKCEVYTDSNIPGIDQYKFAATNQKFVVNLSNLGILNRTVKARSKEEALALELARRWDMHPDSKLMQKPENYKPDFWINSPFFDAIVKKASQDNNSLQKESDVGSGSMHNTGGRMAGEGSPMDYVGVKKMIRREPGDASMVRKGDRYRIKSGLSFVNDDAIFIVDAIVGDKVALINRKGKKVVVDIGVGLPQKFVKV